jgi:beta-glucosidase
MRARLLLLGSIVGLLGLGLALGAAGGLAGPRHRGGPIYRDRSYTPAERAADLVARMTLAEKAAEMVSSDSAAIPRLGIREYGWWNEASHGVAAFQLMPGFSTQLNNTTSYPDDLALGSSWDPGLTYREGTAISDEARELAPQQFRNLDFFAPTVNMSRDPRWGRNDETFSEDPLLTAAMATQYVNGLEGQDEHGRLLPAAGGYLKAIATLKHFAVNNSEVNRKVGSAGVGQRTLREYYTAQFAQIIAGSQPGAMMSSFNEVNGTPAAASRELIDTLARETFGFGGYFTSDCDAIDDIVSGHRWRVG